VDCTGGYAAGMPARNRPLTLLCAVVLLALESLGLAVLSAIWIRDVLTQTAAQRQWAVTAAVVLVLLTVLFGLLAWWLWQGRPGARNPAVVLHLLALPLGYYMISGSLALAGILALVVCATGIGLLLAPPTTRALNLR
jgi:hypothetical protein